jgi:hypothetical protein
MQKFLLEMTSAGDGCRTHHSNKTIPLKAA